MAQGSSASTPSSDDGASEPSTEELFGRQHQREFIEAAVARLSAFEGTTMLWTGPGGVGKTSLLRYGGEVAELAGIPVISGKCTLLDAGRVFGPLVHHWPDLRSDTAGSSVLGRRPASRTSEVDAFLALLEAAAPCVLQVDDLQWADDATIYSLLAAFGRLQDLPVFIMLARRPEPTSPALIDLSSALASKSSEEVIGPLDDAAAHALVAHVLGGNPTRRLTQVLDRAGGNPFYLRQLLEGLAATSMIVDRGPDKDISGDRTPAGVLETVAARIGRLPDDTVQVLEIASTFGATFDVPTLAAVADLNMAALVTALSTATREHLIVESGEQFAFSHDLLREGAYSRLAGPLAALVHTRVAEHLQSAGADEAAIARHVYESNQRTHEAGLLLEAGGHAVLSSNPELAHTYFMRALESSIDDSRRRSELMASSARAQFWAGDSGQAEQYLDDQLVDADPELTLVLSTLRAEILFVQGRLRAAAAAFEEVAQHPDVPKPGLRWAEAGVCLLLGGDLEEAEPLLRRAVQEATRTDDGQGLSEALGGLSWFAALRGDPDRAVELGKEAVVAADADRDGEGHRSLPWMFLGQAHNWADQSEQALEAFRRGQEATRQLGVGWNEPFVNAALSGEFLRQGDWDRAVATAESVLAHSADTASGLGDAWVYATLIEVARRRGDVERASELLDDANKLIADGASQGIDLVLWQQSLLLHQQGEFEPAHDLLHVLWGHLAKVEVWVRAREMAADTVHLALAAGKVDVAWAVAETMEAIVAKTNHSSYQATAHRCRAIVESDSNEITAAIELVAETPRPVEVAGYYEDGAVILLKAGRAGRARPWAQQALQLYEAAGASFDEQRLRQRLADYGFSLPTRRAPRPVSGWDSLTETELEVARLVATGQTSATVAKALGVSRRTVESHLYRIYPKLGVANRVQLIVASASR